MSRIVFFVNSLLQFVRKKKQFLSMLKNPEHARHFSGWFLTLLMLSIFLINFSTAQESEVSNVVITARAAECFPKYSCGDWGECVEGLESRICKDEICGKKDIIERKFCDLLSCKPQVKCTEWSDCVYTDKTDNILEGNIKFGGYRIRHCADLTGCIDEFSEESSCEEFFDLDLKEIRECEVDYMIATDPLSGKEIAKISLESWKNNRLDIIFTQGRTKYCPTCYNGILDSNEEEIDCGRECKACIEEKEFPVFPLIIVSWGMSAVFSVLVIREIILSRRELKEYRKKRAAIRKF